MEEPPYTINGQIITILRSMNLSLISPPVDFTTYSFVINTGATLDISGSDLTIIDLSGLGNIGLGNQTLTITNAVSTFSGVISGVKANLYEDSLKLLGGTLTLSGEKNTYTGQTKIVSPGKLIVTNSKSLGTGQILSDGGNLLVTDTFTISNPFGTFSTTNLATKISASTGKTVTFTDVSGRTPIIIGDADNKGTVIFSNQYNGPVDFSINSNATNMTYGTESLPTFNYTSNFTNGTDTLTTGALTSAAPVYNSASNTKTGNVGDTYPITIGTLVPANFRYTFTYTGNSLTIVEAPLHITASPQSTTYTETFPLEQTAYTVSTLVNGDTFSITDVILKYNNSTTVPPTTNAGTYDIVPSNANGICLTNYIVNYNSGILTVAKAVSTIITLPTATSIVYGQTLASSTLSGGNGSVSGTFAFTTLTTAPSAGTAFQSITFTPTDTSNYNTATGTVSVTVTKAPQIITFPALNADTYGVSPITLSAIASSGLPVRYTCVDGPGSIIENILTIIGAGVIAISANQDGDDNYSAATEVTRTITINKATLTVTADSKTMTYGSTSLPTLTYSTGTFVNGDTISVLSGALSTTAPVYSSGTNTKTGNVGDTYPITIGGLTATNYTISYTEANITIVKALLDITASLQSTTYSETFPLDQIAYTGGTFVNGDIFSITGVILKYNNSTTVPPTTPAGTYDIVPINANGTGLTNYIVNYNSGILTVDKLPDITVPANTPVSDGTFNNYEHVNISGVTNILATATSSLDTTVTNSGTVKFPESNNFKASVNGGEIAIDDGVDLVMTGKVEIDKLTLGANSNIEFAGNGSQVTGGLDLSIKSSFTSSGTKTVIAAAITGVGDLIVTKGDLTASGNNTGHTGTTFIGSGATATFTTADSVGNPYVINNNGNIKLPDGFIKASFISDGGTFIVS